MIKPNELRLGNYVAVKNHGEEVIGKVFAINENLISVDGGNNNYDYHLLEPIPLSEEILLKCGFEKEIIPRAFGVHNIYYDKIIAIHEIETFEWRVYDESDEYAINVELKSIHQLMNLYFSITGKELEVKL